MIEKIPFGTTGHRSSRVIFGAAALGGMSQERADATLALLAPAGVNHIDTAASYGESELRLAPFLADHRADVFLATKTGRRSGSEARAELELSLDRLGVDRVDLIQLHNLVEPDEWETAFAPGGAVEALDRAKEEGLCRFVGVTGHGVRIAAAHLRSLERYDFASVLLPYNHSLMGLADYRRDTETLIELCAERNVAVQTIKSVARRRWSEPPDRRFSWYQPIEDLDALSRGVRYVLGREGLFLNTSSDARLLPAALEVASSTGVGDVPSDEDMEADALRLGITPLFDGSELERI